MKTIVTALLTLLPIVAFAQQGTVTYVEATKLDIDLPPEMAHMADQLPSARTSTKALLFSESASLMKDAPAEEDESGSIEMESDNVHIKMVSGRNESEYFHDLETGEFIEKRDFMGRVFRISGAEAELQWKLTGEQSEFLGYACQKATSTSDSSEVVAWFTPEIPVSAGPGGYFGLPGLVLVVDIDGGQQTYTATNLSLDPVDPEAIVAPTKGKKVTREEFREIFDEKMKEMGAQRNGRGFNVKIVN